MPSKKRRAEDKPINLVKKPLAHAANKFQPVLTENEQLEWALEQSRLQEPIQNEITNQNQHSQPNLPKKELPNHQKIGENRPHQPQAVPQPQAEIQSKSILQPQAGMTEKEELEWALEQSRLQEPIQKEITKQNQHSQPNLLKKELPNHRKIGENHPPQPQSVIQPQTVLRPHPVLQPKPVFQPRPVMSAMTENEQLEWALEQSKLEESMQIEITKHSQLNPSTKGLPKLGENHPPQPKSVLQPQPVFQPQAIQPQPFMDENERLEWGLEQSRLEEPMQIEITKHSQLNLPKKGLPNHQKMGENHPRHPQAVLQPPQTVFQPQTEIQPKPVLQPHPFMTENEQLEWALEQSRLEEPMQIEITKHQNQLSQPNLPNDEVLNHPKVGEYRPIVIDGCNIGHLYGRNQFCAKGKIIF